MQVESLRPFAGPLDTHRELELLEALARAGEGTAAKLLAAELPRVFHSGWAVVLAGRRRRWEVAAASDAAPAFEGVDAAVDAAARPRGCCPARTTGCPSGGGRWRSR